VVRVEVQKPGVGPGVDSEAGLRLSRQWVTARRPRSRTHGCRGDDSSRTARCPSQLQLSAAGSADSERVLVSIRVTVAVENTCPGPAAASDSVTRTPARAETVTAAESLSNLNTRLVTLCLKAPPDSSAVSEGSVESLSLSLCPSRTQQRRSP
jgi:hypothetical protein